MATKKGALQGEIPWSKHVKGDPIGGKTTKSGSGIRSGLTIGKKTGGTPTHRAPRRRCGERTIEIPGMTITTWTCSDSDDLFGEDIEFGDLFDAGIDLEGLIDRCIDGDEFACTTLEFLCADGYPGACDAFYEALYQRDAVMRARGEMQEEEQVSETCRYTLPSCGSVAAKIIGQVFIDYAGAYADLIRVEGGGFIEGEVERTGDNDVCPDQGGWHRKMEPHRRFPFSVICCYCCGAVGPEERCYHTGGFEPIDDWY
jgi:hypothetical protein